MHRSNECRVDFSLPKKNAAFTLAEVLIALVVIGIIAAITLTTVMPNIQERVNSQRQANIVYKITQATNLMKANGAMINGFESTDAFVDELQKYLKIMKRCDSEHIADCWPTKKVIDSEGEKFEVSKAKTRKNLGFKDNYSNDKNVGIVLADGASLIMTYNPANGGIPIGEPITAQTTILPTGGRFQTFLDYTSNTTAGLAFIMDVNGSKGPNKEKNEASEKLYDIRSLNGAHFKGCGGTKYNGKCYTIIDTPTAYNCLADKSNVFCSAKDSNGFSNTNYSDDRWAGAQNDCASLGATMLSEETLDIIRWDYELQKKLGVSGYYWISKLCKNVYGANSTYCAYASSICPACSATSFNRNYTTPKALCIAD